MPYELKINDGVTEIEDFERAIDIINDELIAHFDDNKQCYYNRMPFSVGVLESSFYDDNSITDEQIVIFGRISMLLNRLIQIEEPIKAFDYIKHSYSFHYEDDYIYDLNIIKNKDEIILKLIVDQEDYKDILETNMFSVNKNKSYYFKSIQRVVAYSPGDKLPLGIVVSLDITLTKNDDINE